jgi:hypothetical protein
MAKGAKAACPICGHEVSDPDYEKNRVRGRVLKCANCHNKLEWVKSLLERRQVHMVLWIGIVALGWFASETRLHNPLLRRLDDNIAIVLGLLASVRFLLEKMGFLRPKLRVTDRPYDETQSDAARAKEQDALVVTGPELKTKRRFGLPGFLRGRSALPLKDYSASDPDSQK